MYSTPQCKQSQSAGNLSKYENLKLLIDFSIELQSWNNLPLKFCIRVLVNANFQGKQIFTSNFVLRIWLCKTKFLNFHESVCLHLA